MKTFFSLLASLVSVAAFAESANWYVSSDGAWDPEGRGNVCRTLTEAVKAAKAGDTVWLADGYVCEPADERDWLGSESSACGKWHVAVDKDITVRGVSGDARNDPKAPRIRGRYHDPAKGEKAGKMAIRALCANKGRFVGLVVEESSAFQTASYPSGAICGGAATFEKCVIRNNHSCRGAASGDKLVFRDCVFSNNVGGAVYGCSAYGTVFRDNRGGAAFCNYNLPKERPIVMSGCLFDGNASNGSGGAICGGQNSYNNYWKITDCVFTNNSANYFGGAIYAWGEVSNCTFVGNVMKASCMDRRGGAVVPKDPDDYPLLVTNCTFVGNRALGNGGSAPTRINRTPRLDCTTDKSPVGYKCGETAVVTFATPYTNGLEVSWTMRHDYDDKEVKGTGAVVRVTMERPGFVWINAHAGNGRWPFAYNASVGFDVEKIRPTTKRPEDFDAFWNGQKALVKATPANPRVEEVKSPVPGVKLYKVHLSVAGMGKLASGWLSVPQGAGKKYPAQAEFFGYNNSWGAHHHVAPKNCPTDRIKFLVNAHAYELEREKAHYDEVAAAARSNGYTHGLDPAQNATRETCYFLGMVLRDLTAMEYLKTRPEWNGRDLWVVGHSQGGLQSSWMAALCDGVNRMETEAPWLCNMAGYTEGRIRPVRLPLEAEKGLVYFDPCHMAKRYPETLDAIVLRAGLGDYCCPPSGLAAFYNSIPCPKRITWIQGSEHSDVPIDVRRIEVRNGL